MLSLDQLKKLHKDGITYAKKQAGWFFPPINESIDMQEELVQNAKDLNTFMAAVNITNPTFASAFNVPEPICDNCLLETTPPQFGQGSFGWYFLVGNFGNMAYNFTFVRNEIAPPGAVTLQDRNEAVRWFVCGGYGSSKTDWVTIPYDYIYMKYTPLTYSTFTLVGGGGDYIKNCTLETTQPMTFTFKLEFNDAKGQPHSVQSVQTSLVPPQKNAPNALTKFGLPGLASLYWSYTDMDVTSVIDSQPYFNGKGWLDHQTFKVSGVKGLLPNSGGNAAVFYTVLKALVGVPPINWTWMMIQDEESGIQYMIAASLPKGYNDNPSTFKPGLVMKPNGCNINKNAVPQNNPIVCSDARVKVNVVETVGGHPYPLEYEITLPGGKVVISRAVYGLNLFLNNPGQVSCESPGILFDRTGKKKIGYSVLEINGPLTNAEVAVNQLKHAGGNPTSQSSLGAVSKAQDNYQPLSRKIVAFIIILLPLILLIIVLIVIFTSKSGRWNRLWFVVALLLFVKIALVGYVIACIKLR